MGTPDTNELNSRQPKPPSLELCWSLLARVAASSHLRRAPRLKELLFYVGRRSLKDGCEHIHEQEIGVHVFGRSDNYDSANDSIVRTSISELRKRVDAYFAEEGRDEPLVMEVPRGAYIPVFQERKPAQEAPVQRLSEPHLASPSPPPPWGEGDRGERPGAWRRLRSSATILTLAALLLMSAAGWLGFTVANRRAQRRLQPWKSQPALASLWSSFLSGRRDTDVVMEDSSFLLVQNLSGQEFTLSEYVNKNYLDFLAGPAATPARSDELSFISHKDLGKASDFRVALGIRALDPLTPRLYFYTAREYMPWLLQDHNVILLGNPTSNPWFRLFEAGLNFYQDPDPESVSFPANHSPKLGAIANRRRQAGESESYSSDDKTVSYCAVAYLPKPDRTGTMLLLQGTTSEAAEAGADFLMSEERMEDLEKKLHTRKLPYFELLLRISQVRGTALNAELQAYRTYPNLRWQ